MTRKNKLEKKAVEMTLKLPPGTKVRFWLGSKHGQPNEGVILDDFYVLQGHTLCCSLRSTSPRRRTHWVVAANHVESVA